MYTLFNGRKQMHSLFRGSIENAHNFPRVDNKWPRLFKGRKTMDLFLRTYFLQTPISHVFMVWNNSQYIISWPGICPTMKLHTIKFKYQWYFVMWTSMMTESITSRRPPQCFRSTKTHSFSFRMLKFHCWFVSGSEQNVLYHAKSHSIFKGR